ncbi:MAG: hypothetical protein D084_Lepto4C00442G0001, partial [Leptospirillum sp. Group IV 'UBA BS']
MGGQDVLADQVDGRPEAGKPLLRGRPQGPGDGDVVQEGVEPDVGHVVGGEGDGDPPGHPALGPGDAEVGEGLFEKAHDLVVAGLGTDGLGVGFVPGDEPVLVAAHAEEDVGLADALHRPVAVGAEAVLHVLVGPEPFVRKAVPPLVAPLVEVPLLPEPGQHLRDPLDVPGLGRPDEVVVGDGEPAPEVAEARQDPVDVELGGESVPLRALPDLLAVLVGAGEEEDRLPFLAAGAGQDVGGDGGVGVADMGDVVDVVDGGRQVEPGGAEVSHGNGDPFDSGCRGNGRLSRPGSRA